MKIVFTNINFFRTITLVFLLFYFQGVLAQERKLKEVRIRKNRKIENGIEDERLKSFSTGMQIVTFDSSVLQQYKRQNLSQLLTQQNPVFVKSFGINSMATLNFRGSSSAQSQVLWNGIPLNSATAGLADVSMLNVSDFDHINIVYGGSSALLGSGNVSAALVLDNDFSTKDSSTNFASKFASQYGSFGQLKLNLQERFSTKRLFLSLKISHQQANNNFEFENSTGQIISMTNAQLIAKSAMFNMGYKFSEHSQLKFSVWFQKYDRKIPPAIFERYSVKQQLDDALRLSLNYKYSFKPSKSLYTKSGFFIEKMAYQDFSVGIVNQNKSYQFYQEIGWKNKINVHQELILFMPISSTWIRPQYDSINRFQNRLALAAAYQYQAFHDLLYLSLSARAERINNQSVFLPGFNAAFYLFPFFKLRANIQRSYRAPTLNEWYYQPGGNIQLKPEQGWSADMGYELNYSFAKKYFLHHDVSLFNRDIYDWIIWFGGSIWTPHNIARVHSRGIETFNSLIWQNGKWNIKLGLNTSFVLATTQESYVPNDGSIGKQIPYSPRYNGQANLGLGYYKFSLNYNHTYTGYRFVTTDESQYLKPFQTGNITLSYRTIIKKLECGFQLQCNNVWKQDYQVVNLRPMPLNNYLFSLDCAF